MRHILIEEVRCHEFTLQSARDCPTTGLIEAITKEPLQLLAIDTHIATLKARALVSRNTMTATKEAVGHGPRVSCALFELW